jgi:hypothetical protein
VSSEENLRVHFLSSGKHVKLMLLNEVPGLFLT